MNTLEVNISNCRLRIKILIVIDVRNLETSIWDTFELNFYNDKDGYF